MKITFSFAMVARSRPRYTMRPNARTSCVREGAFFLAVRALAVEPVNGVYSLLTDHLVGRSLAWP
jgi:hypothetical protein